MRMNMASLALIDRPFPVDDNVSVERKLFYIIAD